MGIIQKIKRKYKSFRKLICLKKFRNKKGIEIGGPSSFFAGMKGYPIYEYSATLDNVNFSDKTIWEGEIKSSVFQYLPHKSGRQFIAEASNLSEIPDETYDFLLSSHCLEHCANVLKTVNEWKRVVKSKGLIFLILPNKAQTFDHRRDVTSFSHLIEDFKNNTGEDDLTHLSEILDNHDLSLDPPAGTLEEFQQRSLQNFSNRCLHHHVFDLPLLKKVFKNTGIKTLYTATEGLNLIIIGRKA